MNLIKSSIEHLSLNNRKWLIVLVCFVGDIVNAFLAYREFTNFKILKKVLALYAEHMPEYADILNAPEFQVQIFQLLIKFTITALGLMIFFHLIVYFTFIMKKRFTTFYLTILSFTAGIFTLWYGLANLALDPSFPALVLLGMSYLLVFYMLIISKFNSDDSSNTTPTAKSVK